jgi:hypothetical protein
MSEDWPNQICAVSEVGIGLFNAEAEAEKRDSVTVAAFKQASLDNLKTQRFE